MRLRNGGEVGRKVRVSHARITTNTRGTSHARVRHSPQLLVPHYWTVLNSKITVLFTLWPSLCYKPTDEGVKAAMFSSASAITPGTLCFSLQLVFLGFPFLLSKGKVEAENIQPKIAYTTVKWCPLAIK